MNLRSLSAINPRARGDVLISSRSSRTLRDSGSSPTTRVMTFHRTEGSSLISSASMRLVRSRFMTAGRILTIPNSRFAEGFADRAVEMFQRVFVAAVHYLSERAGFEVVLDAFESGALRKVMYG